ncbi:hypothetical protein Trydic_g22731 [Trypoxylus dichotomus]
MDLSDYTTEASSKRIQELSVKETADCTREGYLIDVIHSGIIYFVNFVVTAYALKRHALGTPSLKILKERQ